MENFVHVEYLEPVQLSRKVVSCSMFIYPQRSGKSDFNDPKYQERLYVYVNGLRRLVEITRDHLPGFCVRLYVDESVQRDTPTVYSMLGSLRAEFPTVFERVLVRASGVLADLRDAAAPGETTFLPSLWRFLAMFDEIWPADVVHMSDLDTPPFIPFTPAGQQWEREKRHSLIFATMKVHVPVFCVMGSTLAEHGVEGCAGSGILSAQRTNTMSGRRTTKKKTHEKNRGGTVSSGKPGGAMFPVEGWYSMMDLIIDTHFRAFLERVSTEDAKALTELSHSTDYQQMVRDILTGRRSCEDETLFENVPLARALFSGGKEERTEITTRKGMDGRDLIYREGVRKSLKYLKLLLLPACDGKNNVSSEFRTSPSGGFLHNMENASIIVKFQYGVDEYVLNGLFRWVGKEYVSKMEEGVGGGSMLSRMDSMEAVQKVKQLSKGVMSVRKTLGIHDLFYQELEGLFSEVWLRIMVFREKNREMAKCMTHAHYTMFEPALQAIGVDRHTFTEVFTSSIAGESGFAKVAWKRVFKGLPPADVNEHEAWNTLFIRFMTKWMTAWVHRPPVNPWNTTGLVC